MGNPYTLQTVMRQGLSDYRRQHPLNPRQRQVCEHLVACRTAALGGLQLACNRCENSQPHYFSCRDRHCPRCQGKATEEWSERQRQNLLPVEYHHLVFTLPHDLNGWAQLHPKVFYALLFEAVWHTLTAFGRNRMQGKLGMTAVLHTWGQNLCRHIHLHCLIPGGALSDKGDWKANNAPFLFPVKALSRHFRGTFVSRLRAKIDKGEFPLLTDKRQIDTTLNRLMQQAWVVYTKPCMEHTETVVDYLARYTHRIALSDSRIKNVDEQGRVRLGYKDYRDNGRNKEMILDGSELIRRFLLHVLPQGFMRVRHYGFLANSCRSKRLAQIRIALSVPEPERKEQGGDKEVAKFDGYPCPKCKQGRLIIIAEIAPEGVGSG